MARRSDARERMMGSAVELFRERGVAATSLSDVVERGDAPRGSVYHYFPGGKAQLAEEATARAGRDMAASLTALTAEHGPVGAFQAIVDDFRRQMLDSGFDAGCPVAAGALAGGEAPAAREVAGEAFRTWEAALSAALWQYGLPLRRAEGLATLSISAVEGALVLARAQRSTGPLDRVREEMSALLGDLVARRGDG
ncbi:helix-turn-helix domain-containing protein [Streptomyces sp. B1866]|uniref:TetR/AcrR family transcriptional regulator n=1 Tax=Streptomyces sp. B1866 TaxID=3075431 RepID=UPI00288F18B8|nr:helix-turn-helix domain-containing protein [Streptomyces sp. B1866]MDT3396592.1 helix-turn-helix domain-containing protein [Streptomyces sp. B1866]